jgi:hypothetical protein
MPRASDKGKTIDCLQCAHFAVTWDPQFPRSCKLFEFKTRELPSATVFKSSGEVCVGFERKGEKKKNRENI